MVALTLGDGTSTAAPVKRAAQWWVETVTSRAALAERVTAWDDLAWNSLEPNPFYEPAMFLPAWERFADDGPTEIALVYRNGVRPQDPPELCGFFPFARERRGPLTLRTLWKHIYCFLCTPLVRQGVAVETLRTLCDWLEQDRSGPAVWQLPHVTADGLFQQALVDITLERQTLSHVVHQYNRALLRPAETAEAYCAQTMTCHNRQELRRQRRRLGEQGTVTVRESQPNDDPTPWIEQFLALEAAGWKGREQSALAAAEADSAYFRQIVQCAAGRRQVGFLGLFLNDRPVALKVNFLSGEGSFAFKIAFDEAFAKFSPGVQLELENIDWVHRQPGVRWMDSCAKPGHFMIGRLWGQRRTIQRIWLSTGRRWGDLVVGCVPALQACRRLFRSRTTSRPTATAQGDSK